MHEDITTAIIGLDESVAFLAVEPLHLTSLRHIACLSDWVAHGRRSPEPRDRKRVAHTRQIPKSRVCVIPLPRGTTTTLRTGSISRPAPRRALQRTAEV